MKNKSIKYEDLEIGKIYYWFTKKYQGNSNINYLDQLLICKGKFIELKTIQGRSIISAPVFIDHNGKKHIFSSIGRTKFFESENDTINEINSQIEKNYRKFI